MPSKLRLLAARCLDGAHDNHYSPKASGYAQQSLHGRDICEIPGNVLDSAERQGIGQRTWISFRKFLSLSLTSQGNKAQDEKTSKPKERLPLGGKTITHPIALYKFKEIDDDSDEDTDDESKTVINGIRVCSLKKAARIHGAKNAANPEDSSL